jgi:hypothetical protein
MTVSYNEMGVSYYSVFLVPCVPFMCSIGSMFLVLVCWFCIFIHWVCSCRIVGLSLRKNPETIELPSGSYSGNTGSVRIHRNDM